MRGAKVGMVRCGKEPRLSLVSDRDPVRTVRGSGERRPHAGVSAGIRGAYSGKGQTYDKQAGSGCRWEAEHRPCE